MNLIVAADSNWGIGKGGTQTVIIPEDRRLFRRLTDGGTVIVGHRTLLDFPGGKPLSGRKNIVFTRDRDLQIEGAVTVSSVEELFRELAGSDPDKVFVIGGEGIFRLLLPYCRRAYVTRIMASPESDSFFPDLNKLPGWTLKDAGEPRSWNGVDYAFQVYENSAPLEA